MTASASRVIEVARGEVGYHEGRSQSGRWNNVQRYSPAVPGLEWSQGQAWCQTFQSWVFRQAGAAGLAPVTASCAAGVAWFRNRGRFSEYPAIGAQVFFGAGGGSHVGLVYAYDATYAYTVEGNAQPVDAAVLTPQGYVRMGDIRVGDEVIDPKGEPSTVTGVHPKGVRRVYRVTMQDGATTEACDEHLWAVEIDQRKPRTVTTLELADLVGNKSMRVRLPQIEPVEYLSDSPLPIAPYLLGALIGEGGMSGSGLHFTNIDQEILDSVRDLLPAGHHLVPHTGNADVQPGNWRITGTGGRGGNHLVNALRDLGLWGKTAHGKFVPEAYRRASVKDRLALLRGLMDTDGTIDAQGRIEFTSGSRQLALDVQELVRSLGGHGAVNIKGKVTYTSPAQPTAKAAGTAYRLQNVNMPFHNPFALARKAERYRARNGAWHRKVLSVEHVRDDEVQCIAVSARSHLYITDDFVPTHNTNATGSAEGDGVYLKKRLRRDAYVYGYGYPAYPGGIVSAAPGGSVVGAPPPFPGAAAFRLNASHPAVVDLDRRLIAKGWARHHDGNGYQPGPVFTEYTRRNVRDFQLAQGWAGTDADGYPGPETWRRLWT